jgi:DNA-directed RNA polymerase beta' subunit
MSEGKRFTKKSINGTSTFSKPTIPTITQLSTPANVITMSQQMSAIPSIPVNVSTNIANVSGLNAVDSIKATGRQKAAIQDQVRKNLESLPESFIENVYYQLFSYEELKQVSVCVINQKESPTQSVGTINDPRMGVIDRASNCATCYANSFECPGHLGRIDLPVGIYHPLLLRETIAVLNCVCFHCGSLRETPDQLKAQGLLKGTGWTRLNRLEKHLKTVGCHTQKCGKQPKFNVKDLRTVRKVKYRLDGEEKDLYHELEAMSLYPDRISAYKVLRLISRKDADALGFSDFDLPGEDKSEKTISGSHPANFILQSIPVVPPTARKPSIEDGTIWPDQLTSQYNNIINKNIVAIDDKKKFDEIYETEGEPDEDLAEAIYKGMAGIEIEIGKLYDNTATQYKVGGGGQQFVSLLERIKGKHGIIRALLMGKRVKFSARTVLSPDPSLKFGQLRVPEYMAPFLTKPVKVASYNITQVKMWAKQGKIRYLTPGHGHQAGKQFAFKDLTDYDIQIGDMVERHLMNGDRIVFNRQPTLHKESFMSYEVVLASPLTFGLHMAYTTPANADFDGDTAAASVMQTLEADAEMSKILNVEECLLDQQKNKAMMGLVYDSIVGMYRLSKNWTKIPLNLVERALNIIEGKETPLPSSLSEKGAKLIGGELNANKEDMTIQQAINVIKDVYYVMLKENFDDVERKDLVDKSTNAYFSSYYNQLNDQEKKEDIGQLVLSLVTGKIPAQFSAQKQETLISEAQRKKITENVFKLLVDEKQIDAKQQIDDMISMEIKQRSSSNFKNLKEYNAISLAQKYLKQGGTDVRIPLWLYNDCVLSIVGNDDNVEITKNDFSTLEARMKKHNVDRLSGRGFLSMLFPSDYYYEKGKVLIVDGILKKGTLAKGDVGPSAGGIVQTLAQRYGVKRAGKFLTDATFIVAQWQIQNPQTVGILDCLPVDEDQVKFVENKIAETRLLVQSYGAQPQDPIDAKLHEQKIIGVVDNVKAVGTTISEKKLTEDNALKILADSGAKGNINNIAQMTGAVAQQYFRSQRIAKSVGNDARCLPYFSEDDESIESRGFCVHSFTQGLDPSELWFLQAAGRQGLIDTALTTAETGTNRRRLAKALEDVKVTADGTVRNSSNVILQFSYGGDGLDPGKCSLIDHRGIDVVAPINVKKLVNEINNKYA